MIVLNGGPGVQISEAVRSHPRSPHVLLGCRQPLSADSRRTTSCRVLEKRTGLPHCLRGDRSCD